jgi:hypothetical protein
VTVSATAVDTDVDVDKRQTCAYTCGTVCYWQEDLDEAVTQGYGYYKDDTQVGRSRRCLDPRSRRGEEKLSLQNLCVSLLLLGKLLLFF